MTKYKKYYCCPISNCNVKMPNKKLLMIHISLRHKYFCDEAEELIKGVKLNERTRK